MSMIARTKQRCLRLLQSSCASMADVRRVHGRLVAAGLLRDSDAQFLVSEMLRFCALSPSGDLSYARAVLLAQLSAEVPIMLSSWNHVVRGYSLSGQPAEAVLFYLLMRRRGGLRPNELTFPFVLKSCAQLADAGLGAQVQADALKNGVHSVVYVQNALMHLYGSCGRIDDARAVFEGMPHRTVVSWNTILTAFVENSFPEQSVDLFVRMKISCEVEPDQTTFVVLLSAAAELGSLSLGRRIHGQVVRSELPIGLQLGTALVNMYAKCGAIAYASCMFERMPTRNVWTWSAMILGYAQHSCATQALELFNRMKNSSVQPNYVTFLGVLCACSHAGLVSNARSFFLEMVEQHHIKPRMEHYSAMVDVLGRNGRLSEAYNFIKDMPVEPDAVVWRTLLSACQLHSSKDIGEVGQEAKRRLLALEPKRSGNIVMVANLCSEEGAWEEAAKMRKTMSKKGLKKPPGESCIEVSGQIYQFTSWLESCKDYESVYEILDRLKLNMKITDSLDPLISEIQ